MRRAGSKNIGFAALAVVSLLTGLVETPSRAMEAPATLSTRPRVDLQKDCGAKGDGVSNDTDAFQKAAAMIQEAGGGTLVIPKATYIVGRQTHEPGKHPYYRYEPIFEAKDLDGLVIEGNGAVIRLASGLRFGSFDKETGEPYEPSSMPFLDHAYRVGVGNMIFVTGSKNVEIRDLELDGNVSELIIGGQWGDTGRQIEAYGLRLFNNTDVTVERVHSHHHALDGIIIGWRNLKESDPPTPHTLRGCVFEYNGRQGLSWVGGRGLKVYRSKFNHTQRATNQGEPFGSAPGAGLDIEAEDSICRDGYFEDCEFLNNGGCGVVADSGDGGHTRFVRCLFWGTTSWSVWSNKPGLKYKDCTFHGSVVHAVGSDDPDLATQWTNCVFEDKPWTDGKDAYGGFLAEINGKLKNVTFDGCSFIAHAKRTIWCDGGGARFNDCSFVHKSASVRDDDFQCLIRGASLAGCHFQEEFPPETRAKWYIVNHGSRVVEGEPTVVDGPRVRWGGLNGAIGEIPPSE